MDVTKQAKRFPVVFGDFISSFAKTSFGNGKGGKLRIAAWFHQRPCGGFGGTVKSFLTSVGFIRLLGFARPCDHGINIGRYVGHLYTPTEKKLLAISLLTIWLSITMAEEFIKFYKIAATTACST